ncbi:hypothetical protein GCM10007140_21850 [Priestia taiwanensis]|uniref:Barstar (barnase inhibitor) domain-containing protein n=2 Tax=Priestia taiwanensis TaxID=1347902 RepID=A0A917AT71_9BACI|nr:hypothetical protein GCM10007140_21850 [Priestia taiwanensis]
MIYDFLREKLFISASIGVVWLAFVLIVNYTEWREVDITDMPISGWVIPILFVVLTIFIIGWEERKKDTSERFSLMVKEEGAFYEYMAEYPLDKRDKFVYVSIDGSKCRDIDSLFQEFERKLKFPSHFKHDWSNFEVCINDLSWMKAPGYLIFICNLDQVLPEDDENFEVFIRSLKKACREWKVKKRIILGVDLYIEAHCTPDKEAGMMTRLEKIELTEIKVINRTIPE